MDPSVAAIVSKAMEGLTARMAVTAENIANANTPNYRPLRVSFEDALAAAAQKGEAALAEVKPTYSRAPAGASMRLDLELLGESSTAQRYSALVEVLNRQFQLQQLAIMGNG